MTLFRWRVRRLVTTDTPPRPQRIRQPRYDDRPVQHPAFPFPDRGYMHGGVDSAFDPCGAGPIESGDKK